jgi:probable HAF family extracellular repeat protein
MGVSPGNIFSYATGVSASGQAASGYDDTTTRGFRWSAPATHLALPLAPGTSLWNYAQAISDDGATVIGWGSVAGGNRVWRWNGGTSTTLGVLAGGTSAAGFAVNANGTFIAGQCDGTGFGQRAARWQVGGPVISLGVLPGGTTSLAYGIDDTGNIIVGNSTSALGTRAYRWVNGVGMQDLGVLAGQTGSGAIGVNSDGSVVVGGSGTRAFRWTPAGGMQDIGQFSAYAVSGNGLVVGGSQGGAGAVVWTPNGGLKNLGTWLPTLGTNLTGWQLSEVRGINADGTVVVGNGTFNGQPRGFVIQGLPCPQTPAVIGTLVGGTVCQQQVWGFGSAEVAAGNGPYTFTWRKNGVPIVSGPTGNGSSYQIIAISPTKSHLQIFTCQPADAGTYDCLITNICGGSTTNGAVLSVATPPTVPGFTFDQFVCVGSTAQVGAGFSSTLPLTYTWYLGSTLLSNGLQPSGAVISGQGTATLTITNMQPADAGTYVCVGANGCLPNATYSSGVFINGGVGFAQQPASMSTCPGGGGSLGIIAPGATGYQWQFKSAAGTWVNLTGSSYSDPGNGISFSVSGANGPTLTIGSLVPSWMQNFRFRCVASARFGCPGVSDEGVISVPRAPFISSQPEPTSGCGYLTHTFNIGIGNLLSAAPFWQVKDGTGNWVSLLDGPFFDPTSGMSFTVFGAGTPTLNITGVALGSHVNPIDIYCLVGGICTNVSSNVVTLTITGGCGCSLADIAGGGPLADQPDGTIDGADFIAFINSYSLGDVNVDPHADVAGGGPNADQPDGTIDGADFIAFFNAFAIGC